MWPINVKDRRTVQRLAPARFAKAEGNAEILGQLASTLVVFDPRFEIMPGTAGTATPEDLNDYEVGEIVVRGE
ncbi:MAG: hypothetical protein E2O54_07180 [Gammaproteobacteria bacterium]|nr:MAG: hypothetical protein E2O54_07180 [Gammaproteobacteria bacterium]